MGTHRKVQSRVLDAILRDPGCDFDQLVVECSDLTWNQVFLEVDRLSRSGHVALRRQGPGRYSIGPRRSGGAPRLARQVE